MSFTSPVIKRSIVILGHKTSISLEDAFFKELKNIAATQESTLSELVAYVDAVRQENRQTNLSSALRLYVLENVQAQAGVR